ncbi:MAG TPA: hypothetical protein VFB34_06145, partial [Chloroflexota bacterium]|nr:hypothetical protein [Chloroflexota bacterium]
GEQFVRYWVHTAHALIDGERMAKSAGNILTVSDLLERGIHPLAYRYFLFQADYRKQVTVTWEALAASQTALDRIWDQAAELLQEAGGRPGIKCADVDSAFHETINDDLAVHRSVGLLHDMLSGSLPASAKLAHLEDFDRVLGLDFRKHAELRSSVSEDQRKLLEDREAARRARDFARSDELRAELSAQGVEVKDTPGGQRWVRRGVEG